jgi:hypothetical protein
LFVFQSFRNSTPKGGDGRDWCFSSWAPNHRARSGTPAVVGKQKHTPLHLAHHIRLASDEVCTVARATTQARLYIFVTATWGECTIQNFDEVDGKIRMSVPGCSSGRSSGFFDSYYRKTCSSTFARFRYIDSLCRQRPRRLRRPSQEPWGHELASGMGVERESRNQLKTHSQ